MKEIKIEKKKVVFEQTPPEYVDLDYFNFDCEMSICNGVIHGNIDFKSFGDDELIKIVKGDYYDDELEYDYDVLEMLKKKTGKEYGRFYISGDTQSDWNYIYLPKEKATLEYIEYIEAFYFGKVDEYYNEDYGAILVLLNVSYKGIDAIKEVIAIETGLSVDEIAIKQFKGWKKIAEYEDEV